MHIAAVDPRGALGPELLATQHAAYALEAELIGDDRIPTLHETLDELRAPALHWLGAFDGEEFLGAIGWTESATELDIDRLFVAPAHARRGSGRSLVRAVLQRAGERRTVVSTGRDNRPARTLYEQLGFDHVVDVEVIPGLWISRYARR